jgi:hypothetical protein
VLSLDLVERDHLDAAASFVVDLLERPASEIRVVEGQLGLDEALVVPGHPDAFELSPVTPVDPGTVWAVDGGSCTVADGRSFQVVAFRAARVRFDEGQTVDVQRPQLDVRAVASEEMARLAWATLTELCGDEPERLPEIPRPVDALREWAEWGAVGRTVREAAPGDLVLVDGSLHGGPLVPEPIVRRAHEEAVARGVSLAGVVKASTLYWGRNAPLVTLLKRRGDREVGPSRWAARISTDPVFGRLAGLADDPAFVGYPYPLARAHQAARVTGYDVVDVRRAFREALSRRGMAEDDVELLFQDFHEVLNR